MDNTFRASNGLAVYDAIDSAGDRVLTTSFHPIYIPEDMEVALREYFLHTHQCDREEHVIDGHAVVRKPDSDDRDGRAVGVLNLTSGYTMTCWERLTLRAPADAPPPADDTDRALDAARQWFDQNPQPRPGVAAKEGEVWIVTTHMRGPEPVLVISERDGQTFRFATGNRLSADSAAITSARRIYPEEDN